MKERLNMNRIKKVSLPPIHGNTREELAKAPRGFTRRTPGFENTLTLTDEIGIPRVYIDREEAQLISNWLASLPK